eukprot:5871207-Pyramimonas_sp.AAC.1
MSATNPVTLKSETWIGCVGGRSPDCGANAGGLHIGGGAVTFRLRAPERHHERHHPLGMTIR